MLFENCVYKNLKVNYKYYLALIWHFIKLKLIILHKKNIKILI